MELKLSNPLLSLRNITSRDDECLYQVYSSTRTEELAQLTNWSESQKEIFKRSQFRAQHNYYQANYTGASFWVIEYKNHVIGRLYLHANFEGKSIRIIDISLLPNWRNKSIGKQVLSDILSFGEDLNRPVSIHVESFNRAMGFYMRLGFELISKTNGVYHLLEWKPVQLITKKRA
ncbi:MAG: GNAT family N-acetyltransferase [Bacteroidota bacterium]